MGVQNEEQVVHDGCTMGLLCNSGHGVILIAVMSCRAWAIPGCTMGPLLNSCYDSHVDSCYNVNTGGHNLLIPTGPVH
eukprot:1158838-Pelagomonas_calceolata.AAC.4